MTTRAILLATIALLSENVFAQCTKDIECKGDRVCEVGVCVSPGKANPSSATQGNRATASAVATPSLLPSIFTAQPPKVAKFSNYLANIYFGKLHGPAGVRQSKDGTWRNSAGKLVDPISINFAGKYYVALNSCGTSCRYYTITDLSVGKELKVFDQFTAAEPAPTTKEGYTYVTELIFRPESTMVIAQYLISAPSGEICREKIFNFNGASLDALTDTKNTCNHY
jgi:hypothetical protein